ncbi:RNA-binding domain-containing protein [Corynebacterium guangdongense]|uniref:ATP-dependent DNA helicase RecG n=1 Tax=Corynebacterium guangdongense TaxID=1783348 RepID=A0ABU2A1S7_9CORY|nr:RNA-binding domain-containing protein [Corynebacterium guangdongense]MDR7330553.1 ATP-dependent DNA helicase RecG [Corynebacterium guangdongense]
MTTWTRERLTELLAQLRLRGETSATIAVASSAPGRTLNLPRTLCAFANMVGGGTIVLGVDEGEGFAVNGVADAVTAEAGITAQAAAAVQPPVPVTVHTLEIGAATVVVMDVQGLSPNSRPATTGGVAYVRESGGERPLTGRELRVLDSAAGASGQWWEHDARPVVGTSHEDLDGPLTSAFVDLVRSRNPRLSGVEDDERLLRLLRVTTAEGELTVAGLYALGFYPQGAEPGLSVTLATRDERVRLEGPLPVLLEESTAWLGHHLPRRWPGDTARPLETPLREVLVDALIHRNLGPETLGAGAAVEVRLDGDTLRISSPGGRADSPANPRLRSLARYLPTRDGGPFPVGDIDEAGLASAARSVGLPAPELADVGVAFTVTFWLHTAEMTRLSSQNESTEERVSYTLELITLGRNAPLVGHAVEASGAEGTTLAEISTATSLSNGQVRYALKALMGAGIVEMDGRQGDRSTVYRWRG